LVRVYSRKLVVMLAVVYKRSYSVGLVLL